MSFIHSIKFKFTLWYLAILGILLVLLCSGIYLYFSHTLRQNLDDSLKMRAAQVTDQRDSLTVVIEDEFEVKIGEVVAFYTISGDELVRKSYGNMYISLSTDLVEQAIDGQSSFTTVETEDGEKLRVYVTPFQPAGPGIHGMPPGIQQPDALAIGRPLEDIQDALSGLMRTLTIAVPLTMLIAGGGGIFLAGRAFKPVDQMIQTAQDIEASDLSRRIDVKTRDELGRLGSTLNQMIDRLEKAFKRQRQFTGDASHELRAPLAVIQAESSLALQKDRPASEYKQSLEMITQEAGHMSSVIDRLLLLARADAGKEQLVTEEINLGNLVRDLCADVKILFREKGLELQLGETPDYIVEGDGAMLKQLFLNLLDNAAKYTPQGGTVSVTFNTEKQRASVAITDTGIGIPSEDIPHIFERFYRVDKARSRTEGSTGLGLAICQHIAEVHGGMIEVESQPEKGSTFTVTLPGYIQA